MGLLDKLWDDTVAGPPPDTGLGKLRKFSSFTPRIDTSGKEAAMDLGNGRAGGGGEDSTEETPRVTRSIMIKRPAGSPSATPPASPAGSTPPISPFFGSGGREWNRFRRKSTSDAFERGTGASGTVGGGPPTTPTAGIGSRSSHPPFDV